MADFSGAMIQGLGALARNPRAFFIGVAEGVKAFVDENAAARMIAKA